MSGSPTVNVPLTPFVQKLSDKNPQFMMLYLAAYARYALENNNDKDELKSSTAAVKSVINLYNLGGAVKKSKFLQKAIEAEKAGNLENWVKENYKAK